MILADKIIALRRVTMEEAATYLERGWRNAPWMGLATLLCIVSPTPLLMLAGLSRTPGLPLGEQTAVGLGIIALMTLVAAAVALFGTCWEATECLLEEGDYTRRNKARRHLVEAVSMAYWLVVTAGYLAYSLTTGSWEHSWAVWPVAGLLYGAAMAFLNLLDAFAAGRGGLTPCMTPRTLF